MNKPMSSRPPQVPSTPTAKVDIDELVNSKDWMYQCTAYSEGQLCCCDKEHPNRAKLEAYCESKVREAKKGEAEQWMRQYYDHFPSYAAVKQAYEEKNVDWFFEVVAGLDEELAMRLAALKKQGDSHE